MNTVRVHMTTTLDGYTAGPNQTVEKPFGEGTEHFDDWMFALKSARELFGEEGGETGPSDDVFRERMANIGAVIMGRKMFGGGPGPWNEAEPWNGWWGENPPYHVPVFVLTHHPREPVEMQGGTTYTFITDGIDSALRQARAAAGEKDVHIAGGADVIRQYLRAGAVDELELHLVPIILGGGESLFDNVADAGLTLEQIRAVPGNGVTHLKYRVLT